SDFFAELIISRLAAELFAHLQRNTPHLGDFVHQVNRQTNRLRLVRQRALDRLFDPPRGISAELSSLGGVQTLDGLHQTNVAVRNQVQQRQTKVGIIVGNLDHESQIGANHERARLSIASFDLGRELNLLLRGQERDLPNLAQVNFYSGI